jgi:hypothetical protein
VIGINNFCECGREPYSRFPASCDFSVEKPASPRSHTELCAKSGVSGQDSAQSKRRSGDSWNPVLEKGPLLFHLADGVASGISQMNSPTTLPRNNRTFAMPTSIDSNPCKKNRRPRSEPPADNSLLRA